MTSSILARLNPIENLLHMKKKKVYFLTVCLEANKIEKKEKKWPWFKGDMICIVR